MGASELSKFIEDELRRQGIGDDEEQRLLSNLRVKPLSVQAPGGGGGAGGWSTKQKVALGVGLALAFGALVGLVVKYRGNPPNTGNFRGAIVDPEAGVEALPLRPRDTPDPAAAKQQAAAGGERPQKQQPAEPGEKQRPAEPGAKQKQAEEAAGGKQRAAPPGADDGAARNATEPAGKAKQEPPEQPGDRRLLRQRRA